METLYGTIEALIRKKETLFCDLADLLKREKGCIEDIDVDALWKFSAEKQRIASRIEGIRGEILKSLEAIGIDHGMEPASFSISSVFSHLPMESRKELSGINARLILLRKEVHALASENRTHVENCLGAVNSLVSIITKEAKPEAGYGRGYSRTTERQNLFIHSEV